MPEPVSHASVIAEMEMILGDPLFSKPRRLSRFLRFGVERVLAGASAQLKEYIVGVEVFERATDYSPSLDPIVRIMAGRRRSTLAEYYACPASDPILVDVPRGGYMRVARASGCPRLERRIVLT